MKTEKILEFSAITVFLLVLTTSIASAERNTFTTIGNPSCKKWTADQKEFLKEDSFSIAASLNRSWVFGFISAINAAVETEKDILKPIDGDTITLWIDKYCSKNPSKDALDAIVELILELRKIAPN